VRFHCVLGVSLAGLAVSINATISQLLLAMWACVCVLFTVVSCFKRFNLFKIHKYVKLSINGPIIKNKHKNVRRG